MQTIELNSNHNIGFGQKDLPFPTASRRFQLREIPPQKSFDHFKNQNFYNIFSNVSRSSKSSTRKIVEAFEIISLSS